MRHMIIQADAEHLPLEDQSVDLTFTSPPYVDARWYDDRDKHARDCEEWIDWMLPVVAECCRVTRGLVLVNCAGVTRDWCYQPAPEGLLYRWWSLGGRCWRPVFWHRVGIPGSGGEQWLRADVEYVLAFTSTEKQIPWADNVANGHVPKFSPGGEFSNRLSNGERVNRDGFGFDGSGSRGRRANGEPKVKRVLQRGDPKGSPKRKYGIFRHGAPGANDVRGEHAHDICEIANPGNLISSKVGGGHMGHALAHETDAPFPLDLPAWFIRSHAPPNGWVLDPFAGSGTTAQAAVENGRNAICCDIRFNQVELMRRRLVNLQPPLFV